MAFTGVTNAHGPSTYLANSIQVSIMQSDDHHRKSPGLRQSLNQPHLYKSIKFILVIELTLCCLMQVAKACFQKIRNASLVWKLAFNDALHIIENGS